MVVPILAQDPLAVPVGVIVLPVSQGPEEGDKADPAEKQRNRYQVDEHLHPGAYLSRSALSDTVMDDADIASAAISGVASPSRAIGTATML